MCPPRETSFFSDSSYTHKDLDPKEIITDPEHCHLCILIQEKQYEMNMMALRIMETNQPSQSEFKNLSETWSNLAQRLAWIHEVECPDLHVGEWLTRSIIVVVRPIVFSCRLLWLSTFVSFFPLRYHPAIVIVFF